MLSLTPSGCKLAASNVVTTTSNAAAAAVSTFRGLAVLAWGRNVEGQCGIESSLLVLRPTPVIELHDAVLAGVAAGKLNSAAITSHGEAWTWGDGHSGKLGHGSAEHVHSPHRVESLVGRADVRQLALGDSHTLFVDGAGGLWACGENKEGQCGLGTPLEVIASQHRRAYYDTFQALRNTVTAETRANREQRARQAIHALLGSAAGGASSQHAQHAGHNGSYGPAPGTSHHLGSGRDPSRWQSLAVAVAGSAGAAGSGVSASGARSALNFGLDFEGAFAASGVQPGQQATPLRIGRDQHPLWAAAAAPAPGGAGLDGGLRVVLPSGLEGERVVGVAASRYFSAALTASGEVWTFGACYNGSLGSSRSWSTSAQKVAGSLAAALEDAGGARQVVSGGSFCAALTAGGRVVLWGKVPGSEGEGLLGGADPAADNGSSGCALGLTKQGVEIVQGGRVVAGVVPGLPPITHAAAGQQHLLLSDGRRVWLVGRAMDASGSATVTAPWRRPALILTLPYDDAVRQLVAGVHSSGVVSEQGHAWVWGRLLDRHHADSVARRHPNLAYDSAAGDGGMEPLLRDDVHWEWAGFGGREPARLEGLGGRVKALALGGWHALAVVE